MGSRGRHGTRQKAQEGDPKDYPRYAYYPLSGRAVYFVDRYEFDDREADGEEELTPTKKLNRETIQKGLSLMAKNNPYQFGLFMRDNYDAITGDVFLQYCLLGEEVYG